MSGARRVHGEPSSCHLIQISRLSELSSIGILIVETVTQTARVIVILCCQDVPLVGMQQLLDVLLLVAASTVVEGLLLRASY